MSALTEREIEPGIVAFLDPRILSEDPRVCNTQDPPIARFGPFLCVATREGFSTWAPITTTPKRARLELKAAWRSGGRWQWSNEEQFLNDGANLWEGPNDAFTRASYKERTEPESRARLSAEGLGAVAGEIEEQAGRRDRDCGALASSTLSGSAKP